MKNIPIIIDTDPGVDDFFCIAIGCAFKKELNLTVNFPKKINITISSKENNKNIYDIWAQSKIISSKLKFVNVHSLTLSGILKNLNLLLTLDAL